MGNLLGDLFGDDFLGGPTTTTTQTQTRNPFEAATPGITALLQGAQALPQVTPTQSEATQQGIAGLTEAAGEPSVGGAAGIFGQDVLGGPGTGTALETLTRTAGGEFLEGNPFLRELVERNTERTTDIINSRFSGIGQRGSPANQEAIADVLARGELGVLAENFGRERGFQQNAAQGLLGTGVQVAGISPTLDEASLFGPSTLLRAGGIEDQFDLEQQLAPFRHLQRQASLINPVATAFGSQTGESVAEEDIPLGSQILGLLASAAGTAAKFA